MKSNYEKEINTFKQNESHYKILTQEYFKEIEDLKNKIK